MRTITAKYPSKCRRCGGAIEKGERVQWQRGRGCQHLACQPATARSGYDDAEAIEAERQRRLDEAEYQAGMNDYRRWKSNVELFGEDYAAQEELAWELRTGEGW